MPQRFERFETKGCFHSKNGKLHIDWSESGGYQIRKLPTLSSDRCACGLFVDHQGFCAYRIHLNGRCQSFLNRIKEKGPTRIEWIYPIDPSAEYKICRKCCEVKHISKFYHNHRNKDNRTSYCRKCANAINKPARLRYMDRNRGRYILYKRAKRLADKMIKLHSASNGISENKDRR